MNVGGSGKGVVSEMNVVPLIDILLVLLIIFMVITPLTPQGLEAHIPQERSSPPPADKPEDAVVVQIAADAGLRINQQAVAWPNLGEELTKIFKSRSLRVAFVQGHGEVEFRHIARAIDLVRGAGIEKVGLLTSHASAKPPAN